MRDKALLAGFEAIRGRWRIPPPDPGADAGAPPPLPTLDRREKQHGFDPIFRDLGPPACSVSATQPVPPAVDFQLLL